MKLFKINTILVLLLLFLGINKTFGQSYTFTKHQQSAVNNNTTVVLNSKYTNIELKSTNKNVVTIEAIMKVDGLSKKEANNYFKKWETNITKEESFLNINSNLKNTSNNNLNRNGFYNGYFIEESKMKEIKSEIKNITKKKSAKNNKIFDFNLYVKDGDAYLHKWQKENNESIGKRWFNKSKEERILLQKARKPNKQPKRVQPKEKLKNKLSRSIKPTANIRALSNRAIIKKTLKITIPKSVFLNIKARHGKITVTNGLDNINADLNYVLLSAKTISGINTKIKGNFTNLEVDEWKSGDLDVKFSDYVLIKSADHINIQSEASIVSIDKLNNGINAKGNFKMLSVDLTSSVSKANITVEDSKQVWIKLPQTPYNLMYNGVNTKLIHPKKFNLRTKSKQQKKQYFKYLPLKSNEKTFEINAFSSTIQIYDIAWKDLKIKNLSKL